MRVDCIKVDRHFAIIAWTFWISFPARSERSDSPGNRLGNLREHSPTASPASPAPASAIHGRCKSAQSCQLQRRERSSKAPCAPWSPGTGSIALQANQGQASFGIVFLVQMLGGLDEHDLERRPDVGLKQMPSPGRPIRPAKHHMGMQFWLSVLKRDVTHQRENLDLLADGDFAIFLRLPVEVAERRFLKRTDGRESCRRPGGSGGRIPASRPWPRRPLRRRPRRSSLLRFHELTWISRWVLRSSALG